MGIDTAAYNLPSTRAGIRAFIQGLKGAGYRFAIIGTQDERCRRFLEVAQEEAFDTSAYKYLYIRYPLAPQVANALNLCGGLSPRLGLDVEDESFAVTWATWVDQIQKAVWVCQEAGVLPEIYTSTYKWRKLTGNSQAFSSLPLWDAFYDGVPTLDNWGGPYGGWEKATIKQYHNTTPLLGVDVDLNVRLTA